MRDKYINYAEKISSSNEDIKDILEDLKNDMHINGLFFEEGKCAEKIFNITKNPNLYLEAGDIYLKKARNREVANTAYNKYLFQSMPDFYNNYANNLSELGINCIDIEITNNKLTPDAIKMCDRYDIVSYMMICLHKLKDYDGVTTLFQILNSIEKEMKEVYHIKPSVYQDTKNHLSKVFSKTINNNDINNIAIILDKNNKQAYINIIDNLIENKNYDEAMDFYENKFKYMFFIFNACSLIELCWNMSDYYSQEFNYYNAVKFQKIALELELEKINA